jgi:hypothetical protein
MVSPDEFLDDRLEPADDCARRADLRRRLRDCLADPALVREFAEDIGMEPEWLERRLAAGSFGAAWADIEQTSTVLQRRRVAVEDLPKQMARAQALCTTLREKAALHQPETGLEAAA